MRWEGKAERGVGSVRKAGVEGEEEGGWEVGCEDGIGG
jgi:hypothetical protein